MQGYPIEDECLVVLLGLGYLVRYQIKMIFTTEVYTLTG
jgi:hypothetical protein